MKPQLKYPYAFIGEILITQEQIQERVKALGEQITLDYQDSDKLLLLGLLRGSVMFMTDLVRQISVPLAFEFMAVSSYGAGARRSSGEVRITLDLNTSIAGNCINVSADISRN